MLIANFYRTTGSLFYQRGKNESEKIAKNGKSLTTIGIIETSIVISVVSFVALAALTNIDPLNLSSIPLTLKVAIIGGGVSLLILDNGYAYCRLKKIEKELPLIVEDATKQVLDAQVESEEEYSNRLQTSANRIKEWNAIMEKIVAKIKHLKDIECQYEMNEAFGTQTEADKVKLQEIKQNIKYWKELAREVSTFRKQEEEVAKKSAQEQEESSANIQEAIKILIQLKKDVS